MTVTLNLETIKTLISPRGSDDPLVFALYIRQYQSLLRKLIELHKLLIAEAPELADTSGFAEGFAQLSTFQVAVQRRICEYPAMAFWINVAWDLIARESHIRLPEMHIRQHLADFSRFVLAAVVMSRKESFSFGVRTDAHGRVMLPGSGYYLQVGSEHTYSALCVCVREGGTVASVEVQQENQSKPLDFTLCKLPVLANGIEINAVDSDLRLAGRTGFIYEQPTLKDFHKWRRSLDDACSLIHQLSPAVEEEMRLGIRVISPVRSASVDIHLSGSFREAPGLIAFSWTPDALMLAEALVHEYHHQKLNSLMAVAPLISECDTDATYYSPWRSDPRPLSGILHGSFTFQAILEFYSLAIRSKEIATEDALSRRAYKISCQLKTAISVLSEHARFTPLGQSLLVAINENVKKLDAIASQAPSSVRNEIDRLMREHQKQWTHENSHLLKNTLVGTTPTSYRPIGGMTQDPFHSAIEGDVLASLQLPPEYNVLLALGSRDPFDEVLQAVCAMSYDNTIDKLRSCLANTIRGKSVLLDLLRAHVAYVVDDYHTAAACYRACIMHDIGNEYFWRCYAFALRHLHQWDDSLLILIHLPTLTREGQIGEVDTGSKDQVIELRLADIRNSSVGADPVASRPCADAVRGSACDTLLATFLEQSPFRSYLRAFPTGLQLPMFMAMVHNLKPAMDVWVRRSAWSAFERLISDFKLCWHVDAYFDHDCEQLRTLRPDEFTTTRAALSQTFKDNTEAHVFLATNESALYDAVGAGWYPLVVQGRVINKHMADHHKFGNALGYPPCCQQFFREHNDWRRDNNFGAAYKNTLNGPKALSNGLLRLSAFGLVPHIPCSFACEATASYAARVHAHVAMESQSYANEIARRASSPFLCLSELRIYRFEGERDGS